jgi:hypothetical protein
MQWLYCFIPIGWTALALAVGYWFGRNEIRLSVKPRRRYEDG